MARIREQFPLVRYLGALIDELIANPAFSRHDAVQFLRHRTVGIDQAEAPASYEQLAVTYIAVGLLARRPPDNHRRSGDAAPRAV